MVILLALLAALCITGVAQTTAGSVGAGTPANCRVTNAYLNANGTVNNINDFGMVSGARDPRKLQLSARITFLAVPVPLDGAGTTLLPAPFFLP